MASPSKATKAPSAQQPSSVTRDVTASQRPAQAQTAASVQDNEAKEVSSAQLARTIDEIERDSAHIESHRRISEDIQVLDGRVYRMNGAPYMGTLSPRQLALLRYGKRLYAFSPSSTERDFVTMPDRL